MSNATNALPTTGPYSNMLSGFLGNYSSTVQSAIWTSFLESQNLKANPANDDTTHLLALSKYVKTYCDNLLPEYFDEIHKTMIISSVFDILIRMLETSTITQIASQATRTILTKKQEEYRKMMAKTVLYKGDPEGLDGVITRTVISQDPAQFKLGYGDFTMKDIFDYLVTTADQNYANSVSDSAVNKAATFQIGRPSGFIFDPTTFFMGNYQQKTAFSFSVQKDAEGAYQVGVKLSVGENLLDEHMSWVLNPKSDNSPYTVAELNEKTAKNSSQEDGYNKIQSLFYNIYNKYTGVHYDMQMGNDRSNLATRIQLSWPDNINYYYSGGDNDKKNEFSKQSGIRGESNKRAQTSIDSIKSRVDILKDFASQQAQSVSASSDAKGQISSLIESILQQLKNILDSAYKSG